MDEESSGVNTSSAGGSANNAMKTTAPSSASSVKRESAEECRETAAGSNKKPKSGSPRDELDAGAARPVKREKTEERVLEMKWLIGNHDANDEWVEEDFAMFADEIPRRGGMAQSRAILENEQGENHQYGLDMCLVDGKSEHRKTLVSIDTWYWTVPINLMHFNILSADLADFCRPLWVDAGRRESEYSDMAIEFGESKHCGVKISTLVRAATGIGGKKHVMYVRDVKMSPGSTLKDAQTLLRMMFSSCPAILIAHETDLTKLQIQRHEIFAMGFERIGSRWYVGPNKNVKLVKQSK